MSIEHIRNVAKYGVLTDPDPYDIPTEAWSMGVNVRFRNAHISGGPIFRDVFTLGTTDPRFSVSATPTSDTSYIFTGYLNGTVSSFTGTAEVAYSPSGYTPASAEAFWSTTTLGNVIYINRSDRAPWYLRPGDATFQNLGVVGGAPASWDSTYSCAILRSCGGALVALNVTKGAANEPQMVKTSSIPLSDVIPASWDPTVANSLATENILAEMKGPIIDAQKFGSELIIYGQNEAWIMQADGSTEVYNYQKLPFQKGTINSNCSFELNGTHFVFGPDDIWQHNGTTPASLCDGEVRNFIFNSLDASKVNRCFIAYNPALKEMSFCYSSGDAYVNFLGYDGCNRAAVYNIVDKTWTFDDLPLVFGYSNANLSVSVTYATVTSTYATVGGAYVDQQSAFRYAPVYVGALNTAYSLTTQLYAQDLGGVGSAVVFPVDLNASAPRTLIRNGIDLDSLNIDLRGYKVLSSLYPQGRFGIGSQPLMLSVGGADYFNIAPVMSAPQPYDGDLNYKLDFNTAGRYLSMTITHDDYKDMALSGFDVDLHVTGTV